MAFSLQMMMMMMPSSSVVVPFHKPLLPFCIKPIKASLSQKTSQIPKLPQLPLWISSSIGSKSLNFLLSTSLALAFSFSGVGFAEAKVGVNKPELLPKEFTTVIDVAGFLSDGQEKRIAQEIAALEKDTGYKLRVLAQNYPDTPGLPATKFLKLSFESKIETPDNEMRECRFDINAGLAIKDFWKVDDSTIVFVADPTFGNILNFNVGATVDLDIPRSFWSRLAGKYGNMFYWKEKGEDASIEAAVMAISTCLREPVGANNCSEVQ